ncbi:hypothetical protein [Salinarimonas soli]|uniref:Uncharacterized protein n=1 Tax=Salinarimonas soli TaxID=1638099 RepID=A0A5B2VTH0_9HYPH|nr:hypothetical protein [Salinarimonas soli]KAA2242325.1 hypothetical protein F0L46_03305 [Salinarimonas soli]
MSGDGDVGSSRARRLRRSAEETRTAAQDTRPRYRRLQKQALADQYEKLAEKLEASASHEPD